jgi:hypothetical protein
MIQCGHCFHIKCIESWLVRVSCCPVCHAPVEKVTKATDYFTEVLVTSSDLKAEPEIEELVPVSTVHFDKRSQEFQELFRRRQFQGSSVYSTLGGLQQLGGFQSSHSYQNSLSGFQAEGGFQTLGGLHNQNQGGFHQLGGLQRLNQTFPALKGFQSLNEHNRTTSKS